MFDIFTILRLRPVISWVALLAALPLTASAQNVRPTTPPVIGTISLPDVIRAALSTHPAIGAARERVIAARGSLRTARTWSNPLLTYQVEQAPLPGSSAIGLEREESIFAMLPLEPLYQLGPRSARARSELRSAEFELSDMRRVTVLAATSAFYRAASAQVAVESAEDVSRWLDSLVAYTGNRVREGAAAEADLLRLQVEQGRAEVDLAMARMDLGHEIAELSAMTSMDAQRVDIALPSAEESLGIIPSLDSLISLSLARRADVAAATARVDAAAEGVSVERRAVIREVGAMAGVMRIAGGRSLMDGVSVPFPLFDRNGGEIQRAVSERKAAAFEADVVRRRVVSEIRSAFAAAVSLRAALQKTGNLVSRARESRRIAEAAYREGAVPLNQVIDASRALADARQAYAKAYFGLKQSLFELTSSTTFDIPEASR